MGRHLGIDIICQVVDNYGDIAVVWRLAQALVEDGPPDLQLRLLVDDWDSFADLQPNLDRTADRQLLDCRGKSILALRTKNLQHLEADRKIIADVIVEAFGAPTPVIWLEGFLAASEAGTGELKPRILLHLEYLSAEAWTEDYHLLPSPVGREGVMRYFFVPGFLPRTGGLVFTSSEPQPPKTAKFDWLMTLFSYEHDFTAFWEDLVSFLQERNQSAQVVIFAGRSRKGALESWDRVRLRLNVLPSLSVVDQPFVDQETYTALLARGDFHVVRGEESWTQAILSGKAFLWHAYLQAGSHQSVKVEAFLEVWRPRFDREGEPGRRVFDQIAREFRAFNERVADSAADPPRERYRVFWENRDLIERVGSAWAEELRKNAKLSKKMLEFLEKYRV